MRTTTHVAAVRIIAAVVFIGAAGLLVQSFAEGDQASAPAAAKKAIAAADGAAFPDFLVPPVKVRTTRVPAEEIRPDTPSIPDGNDPRWGKSVPAARPAASAPAGPTVLASLQGHAAAGFPMITGSTAGEAAATAIAGSGDAVAREHVAVDAAVLAAAAKDFGLGRAEARTSRTTSDVRLRARGVNGADIIGVIPRGSEIGVVRCSSWCEVTYEGKRGFVYSGFVSGYQGRKTAVRRAAPAAEKPAAEEVAEAKAQGSWLSRVFANPVKPPETGIEQ